MNPLSRLGPANSAKVRFAILNLNFFIGSNWINNQYWTVSIYKTIMTMSIMVTMSIERNTGLNADCLKLFEHRKLFDRLTSHGFFAPAPFAFRRKSKLKNPYLLPCQQRVSSHQNLSKQLCLQSNSLLSPKKKQTNKKQKQIYPCKCSIRWLEEKK